MSQPINLNKVRKAKAKAAKAAQAKDNRRLHGLTKSQKIAAKDAQDKLAKTVDSRKRKP